MLGSIDEKTLPPSEKRKLEMCEKKAEADCEKMLKALASGQIQSPVSFENGDQSPLDPNSEECEILVKKWANRMDYYPMESNCRKYLSKWVLCIWYGDHNYFMNHVFFNEDGYRRSEASQDELILKRRETFLNVGPLFHVIYGARCLLGDQPDLEWFRSSVRIQDKEGHMKIFDTLLNWPGADLEVRDVIGSTPLHWCLSGGYGNEVTKQMAVKLIKKGANIDARDRRGHTVLLDCSLLGLFDFVSFLLDQGADTDIPDNNGVSPQRLARIHPELEKLFKAADAKKSTEARKEAHAKFGGNFKQCKVCKKYKNDTKRCSGCYLVWYCGPKCQKDDWSKHMVECKETRKEYVKVHVQSKDPTVTSLLNGSVVEQYELPALNNLLKKAESLAKSKSMQNKPSKGHFIVSVQIATKDRFLTMSEGIVKRPTKDDPMLIFNKDQTLYGDIEKEGNEIVFAALSKNIEDHGFKGFKGYFYAIYKSKNSEEKAAGKLEIKINTSRILPVEDW